MGQSRPYCELFGGRTPSRSIRPGLQSNKNGICFPVPLERIRFSSPGKDISSKVRSAQGHYHRARPPRAGLAFRRDKPSVGRSRDDSREVGLVLNLVTTTLKFSLPAASPTFPSTSPLTSPCHSQDFAEIRSAASGYYGSSESAEFHSSLG